MTPTLSVIILTRDRLAMLQRCLEALLPQLETGDEVVVVDTGSTDGTREHYRHGAGGLRIRFFELNLSGGEGGGSWAEARNFGVSKASGQMIAFLDDDCLAAPDWVARGKAVLAGADAVGGIARASGIAAFPKWWHPEMGWMAGLSVPGHAGPDAGRVHYPMTCNLWARAEACRAVPFQEIGGRLEGHAAANYLAGREDAQWWRALRVGGYRTRFDPQLRVGHAIDPARLDLDYLLGRAERDGQAWAAREGLPAEDALPTAYGWWHCLARQALTPLQEPETWACHWHYHRLCRRRQAAALRALAEKRGRNPKLAAPALQWAFWQAGARWMADRGRTLVHAVARPWLVARPDRGDELPVERLAVLAFGYLGDLVILQSALRGLSAAYPHLTIHVVAPPGARAGLGQIPRMVASMPPKGDLKPAEAQRWLAGWLRDVRPDSIVAPYLHGDWGRAAMALRRPPRPMTGFDQDSGLEHKRHLERLSTQVHKNLERHELDNLLRLLEVVGLPCQPAPARIQPEAAALGRARACPFVADAPQGAPMVLFNPDAGQAQKEWTDERWAELTRLALDRADWRIVINASRPRAGLEERVAAAGPAGRVHWLREAPMEDLVAWLSLCAGIVTVDAGPQHLAHALGVPSVTLYGPMDERRWRDWWRRPMHRTIRACAFDLTPEERRGLPVNSQVALIEPEAVFAELQELLPLEHFKDDVVAPEAKGTLKKAAS